MALDHYVSPVHLEQFCAPARGGALLATKKSDLRPLQCGAKSVCRIEMGAGIFIRVNPKTILGFCNSKSFLGQTQFAQRFAGAG